MPIDYCSTCTARNRPKVRSTNLFIWDLVSVNSFVQSGSSSRPDVQLGRQSCRSWRSNELVHNSVAQAMEFLLSPIWRCPIGRINKIIWVIKPPSFSTPTSHIYVGNAFYGFSQQECFGAIAKADGIRLRTTEIKILNPFGCLKTHFQRETCRCCA